jgi:fatty acid/phospholipid biosynthesis enzyme
MGGDVGVRVMIEGAALARRRHDRFKFLLVGDETRIRRALDYLRPEQLWINPDCGLQTLPREAAIGKMRNLVEAAGRVRETLT